MLREVIRRATFVLPVVGCQKQEGHDFAFVELGVHPKVHFIDTEAVLQNIIAIGLGFRSKLGCEPTTQISADGIYPAASPDINPMDFCEWSWMLQCLCDQRTQSVEQALIEDAAAESYYERKNRKMDKDDRFEPEIRMTTEYSSLSSKRQLFKIYQLRKNNLQMPFLIITPEQYRFLIMYTKLLNN